MGGQPVDRAWLNDMAKRPRIDPADFLKSFRPLMKGIDPKTHGLRASGQKRQRELVEACLFSYGLACAGKPTWIVDHEGADYDFVIIQQENDDDYRFSPTQHKEVVASHRNPNASVQSVIDALTDKYPVSEGLTVAIRINQTTEIDLEEIKIPPALSVSALWVYGGASPDGSRWLLGGNLMEAKPGLWFFNYPT
jgi:hypothetical protein